MNAGTSLALEMRLGLASFVVLVVDLGGIEVSIEVPGGGMIGEERDLLGERWAG